VTSSLNNFGLTHELVLLAADVGYVHVVGGGAKLFELLGGEDVDGDEMDLGVTVLAGLRGGHLDDLAGTVLDDDETVLPQGRALHGVGGRGAGIGALEGVLMLQRMSVCLSDLDAQKRLRCLAGRNTRGQSIRWGRGAGTYAGV
jgi:hypothetical protein